MVQEQSTASPRYAKMQEIHTPEEFAVRDSTYSYVYLLRDPRKAYDARYVGVTNNPPRRLWEHLGPTASVAVQRWVAELAALKQAPYMVIVAFSDDRKCAELVERQWIQRLATSKLRFQTPARVANVLDREARPGETIVRAGGFRIEERKRPNYKNLKRKASRKRTKAVRISSQQVASVWLARNDKPPA